MKGQPPTAETLQQEAVASPLQCWRCNRRIANAAPPGTDITCPRCHARNQVPIAA